MIVLKINKRFDHQKNKMAVDINSTEVRRFIEYLDTHAIFFDKLSQGDKAKYALYIEIITFSITIAHDKSPHLRSGNCKKIDRNAI